MIEHRKRKPSKRELVENDGYSKHQKAKPYVRQPLNKAALLAQADEDDVKSEQVTKLLGDWDANGV